MTGIEWIFFDMGSTLVDEEPVHDERIYRSLATLHACGADVTYERFQELAREGAARGESPYYYAAAKLGLRKKVAYAPLRVMERAYPQSAEVLGRLRGAGYKLGIIANQHGGTVRRLKRFGLLGMLDFVWSSSEIGIKKPDIAFYSTALAAANASPRRSVMVGDRVDNDIAPAKAAGMRTVRVRQCYFAHLEPSSPEQAPDVTIESISDLPSVIGTEG